MMKKILCFLLCLLLSLNVLAPGQALAAAKWPSDVAVSADGAILMDSGSGAILYEKNSRQSYYPASITKILTALVIIENCNLDDTVTFSSAAVNTLEPGASILGARAGDQMSVRDCLYALLLQSANEVANALAEHCSGSIEAFAELMNSKAASLGCVNSNFVNPSGLNDPDHYTCAYDMALIAQACFADPVFVEIDSTTWHDVPAGQLKQYPEGWRYYAHHRMLKKNDSAYYSGIIGGKTGYTSLAGNTLVTCAQRDGMKLVTVVLNGHQTHYSDTKALLDFGFQNFKSVAVADNDSTYQKIEQDLSINGIFPGDTLRLSVNKNSVVTLPAEGDFSDVTSTLDYELTGTAPDSAIACIEYMYGDKKIGQAYLEAIREPGYTLPDDPSASTEETSAFTKETSAAETDASLQTEEAEIKKSSDNTVKPKLLPILKKVLIVAAGLGAIAALIFGILAFREHRERNERILRQQRRENRLKRWGYSTTEFDKIMEDHIRSRSTYKKPGFRDRFRRK